MRMRNKILSLLFGILMLSLTHLGAEDSINVPISQKDSNINDQVLTIVVDPKPYSTNVRFNNMMEALTGDQINTIVRTLEESSDAAVETSFTLNKTLLNFNSLLEEKSFMMNKVIYQADRHYNLSESEVKRSLRKSEGIDLIAYVIMLIYIILGARTIKRKAMISGGYIDLDKMLTTILAVCVECCATWFIVRPVASILLNHDFEIIKFLLQGA